MEIKSDKDKAPLKYSVHMYDLNAMNIVMPSDKILKTKKGKRFSSGLVQNIRTYCHFEKIDFDFYLNNKYPIIIPSTHNFHFIFLEYTLCHYDHIRIPRFLNYQYEHFKGNYYAENKEQFIGLIESVVYPWIKKHHPGKSENVLKGIMTWIDMVKPVDVLKAYPNDFFVTIKDKQHKEKVLNIFLNYFNSKDLKRLNELLSGKPILGKLIFLGASNQLYDAFKRLVGNQIVNSKAKSTERWLEHFFLYQTEGTKPKPISAGAAHQIISSNTLLCKKPISQFAEWLPLKINDSN